jgi:hypothetical protein
MQISKLDAQLFAYKQMWFLPYCLSLGDYSQSQAAGQRLPDLFLFGE